MRRLLYTVLTGLALLISLGVTSATAQAAAFPSTVIATTSGIPRCIGPLNGGTADGTPLVLANCAGASQLWHGTGGNTPDRSVRHVSGKCLSLAVTSSPVPVGTRLVLRDCSGVVQGDQQWTFVALTPGGLDRIWVLRNGPSLRCATVSGGGTSFGTPLVLQNCSFRFEQQWVLANPPSTYGFSFDDGLA
ncbi:hypothetical protein GCM10022419_092730 [Nonomuraea rosea]|uniref:Ricin B lectin domain-containing protein n=1 Tax=Nonomuraea rosea TaxID=638574 RepID=A0ABP6YZF1_9ACTN